MSRCFSTSRGGSHRGLTLVELMVTMGIAAVLLAIALPTIKFTIESSKVREASRQVNGLFASAKARASSTGRAVGIWLERDPGNYNVCTKLYLTEVPQPYAGQVIALARGGDREPALVSGDRRVRTDEATSSASLRGILQQDQPGALAVGAQQ